LDGGFVPKGKVKKGTRNSRQLKSFIRGVGGAVFHEAAPVACDDDVPFEMVVVRTTDQLSDQTLAA
jgi:hypothetical protein